MVCYKIETLDDAELLANTCDKYPFNIDVVCGIQTVNGKSVLGVASLLGNFVSVIPITDNKMSVLEFEETIKTISKCY